MFLSSWLLLFLSIVHTSYGVPSIDKNTIKASRWTETVEGTKPTWHQELRVQHQVTYETLLEYARELWNQVTADNGRARNRLCMTNTKTCFVAALYIPENNHPGHFDGYIYASTIPRGSRHAVMKTILDGVTDVNGEDVSKEDFVWYKSAKNNFQGGKTPFHAEDACYFNFESSGKSWFQLTDKEAQIYPYGSRIALWGVYDHQGMTTNEWKNGRVIFPCNHNQEHPERPLRDPTCAAVASDLGVAFDDSEILPKQRGLPGSYSGSWGDNRWERALLCAEKEVQKQARLAAAVLREEQRATGGQRRRRRGDNDDCEETCSVKASPEQIRKWLENGQTEEEC